VARLVTSGFEQQQLSTVASEAEGEGFGSVGTVAIETSVVRSGAASVKIDGAHASSNVFWLQTVTAGTIAYLRAYVRIDGTPTTAQQALNVIAGSTQILHVRINTDRTLTLRDATGVIGSASAALSTNTWYRVEVVCQVNTTTTGFAELYLDGVQVATASNRNLGTASITRFRVRARSFS
jgi:hypothetical protein